jgi:hypothetical protein
MVCALSFAGEIVSSTYVEVDFFIALCYRPKQYTTKKIVLVANKKL